MNAANTDDADDEEDDDDAVKKTVCPKVSDVPEALQVLHDCMPFSISSEDIQQKLNALSILVDRLYC